MDVEVVLTHDDPKLGKRGQVVKVSGGFANNFLFPNNKAKLATPSTLKIFQAESERQERKKVDRLQMAKSLAEKISGMTLNLEAKIGEGEKLYGAVTSQEIHRALTGKGVLVEKRDIQLLEPIKKLGSFEIPIKLHREVPAILKLTVTGKK